MLLNLELVAPSGLAIGPDVYVFAPTIILDNIRSSRNSDLFPMILITNIAQNKYTLIYRVDFLVEQSY